MNCVSGRPDMVSVLRDLSFAGAVFIPRVCSLASCYLNSLLPCHYILLFSSALYLVDMCDCHCPQKTVINGTIIAKE